MTTHNIAVILTGNNTSLKGALTGASRDIQGFSREAEIAGKTSSQSGQLMKMGLAAGATAVAAGLAYAVGKAAEFDTQMRNVQSITKESDASLGVMGKTLVDLSTKLPQSAATLAEGLYNIASSGFSGADGLTVLKASADAASAGLTTTEVSARAITSVLNAYGEEASQAGDISDVLFQTVNLGVISFEELAGAVGDVVGTASAATVKIDEVGSAIATMTLAGIGGAEASTSLNRVLTSLLDPTDELQAALSSLGYESGVQALQVDTLDVVMEKLRGTSEGNITTLMKWFPEIRSLRGALALMANDGQNYTKVVGQIQDQEARAGATRAALTEQLKAASAQWQIFKNRIDAAAITVGTSLLPVVTDTLALFVKLGQGVMPVLIAAADRLNPLWSSLAQIGANVVTVTKAMVDILGPAGKAFGALIGMSVITLLNLFGKAVEAVTGFLADNKVLVQVLAALLAGAFLSSVYASVEAWIVFQTTMKGGFFSKVATEISWAMESLGGFTTALQLNIATQGLLKGVAATAGDALKGLAKMATSPTAAFTLLTIGVASMVMSYQAAQNEAKKMREEVEKKITFTSPGSIKVGIDTMKDKVKELREEWHKYDGVMGVVNGTLDVLSFGKLGHDVDGNAASLKAAKQAVLDYEGALARLKEQYAVVAGRLGTTTGAVQAFVDKLQIDPSTMTYDELATAIGNVQTISEKATPQQVAMSEAYATVADAAGDAKTQTEGFKKALDALFGIEISLFDAQTDASKGIRDFAKEMKEAKASGIGAKDMFSELTDAGDKNRDSLSAVTETWLKLAQAKMDKGDFDGAVGALKSLDTQLRTILHTAGLTTPEIDALLAQLGLVPGNYDALVGVKGQAEATKATEDLVAGLRSKTAEGVEIPLKTVDHTKDDRATLDYWIAQYALTDPTTVAYVNGRPAEISWEHLKTLAKQYGDERPEAKALLDYLDPTHKFTKLSDLAKHWDEEHPEAIVSAKDLASGTIGSIDAALRNLPMNPAPRIGVHDEASYTIGSIDAAVRNLPSVKNITVKVKYQESGSTSIDGYLHNRTGGVYSFASGGMTPAHIARGQMIRYAEPETGGEAFIPRIGNKARSTAVLKAAAAWYGLTLSDIHGRTGSLTGRAITYPINRAASGAGKPSSWDAYMKFMDSSSGGATKAAYQARLQAAEQARAAAVANVSSSSNYAQSGSSIVIGNGAVQIAVNSDGSLNRQQLESLIKTAVGPALDQFTVKLTKELRSRG